MGISRRRSDAAILGALWDFRGVDFGDVDVTWVIPSDTSLYSRIGAYTRHGISKSPESGLSGVVVGVVCEWSCEVGVCEFVGDAGGFVAGGSYGEFVACGFCVGDAGGGEYYV